MAHDSTEVSPRGPSGARAGICEVPGWGRFVLAWRADEVILLGLPDRAPGEHLGRLASRGVITEVTATVPETFRRAVEGYCAGDPGAFGALPSAQPGTPFQQAIWGAMREIPLGETRSYGALARAAGHPGAVRAVGNACAANLVGILVPCHRVIGTGGAVGGFAAGVAWKRRLLEHELRIRARREALVL